MKRTIVRIWVIAIIISCNQNYGFSQLKVLSSGKVTIPASQSLWFTDSPSPTDNGPRLKLLNNGTNSYIDYFDNLYLRSGLSASSTLITLTSTGRISVGNIYGYPSTGSGKLQINGTGLNNGLSVSCDNGGVPINMICNSDGSAYIHRGSDIIKGKSMTTLGKVGINGSATLGTLQINGGQNNGLAIWNGVGSTSGITIFHCEGDDKGYITRGNSLSGGISLINDGKVGINGTATYGNL